MDFLFLFLLFCINIVHEYVKGNVFAGEILRKMYMRMPGGVEEKRYDFKSDTAEHHRGTERNFPD